MGTQKNHFNETVLLSTQNILGMIWKFWSWCDISVTCDATCLKIVPHNTIFFVYTLLWHVLCNLKERPEIYPKTVMPSMHWPINQTVHVRDATILTSAVSAFCFYGCVMIIRKPICSEKMANFLYDLGFLGRWMYGYATVSLTKFGPLEALTGPYCCNNSCIKCKNCFR